MKSDDMKATATDAIGKAGKLAETVGEKASDKASDLAGASGDYTSRVSDAASSTYDNAKARISDVASQFPGSAADALEAGKGAYAAGSDQIVRQVAKQPIEALLLAGAIGFLVGWAANRS